MKISISPLYTHLLPLALALIVSSCAQFSGQKGTASTPEEAAAPQMPDFSHLSEAQRIVKEALFMLEHFTPQSDGGPPRAVIGSSQVVDPLLAKTEEEKGFYLFGAEHLNLENPYFDFPIVYNAEVQRWMTYFTEGRGRGFFERYSARSGRYAPILGKILEDIGMPRDLIFLAMAESGFQTNARSWARAVGPWQFMAFTGRRYGLTVDWFLDERRDPIKSTKAAARYLSDLYQEFGSWELAAAGYNAGEGRIRRAIARFRTDDFWEIRRHNHLARETREYVPKIYALAIIGKNLRTFGFNIEFERPLEFEEIEIGPMIDLMKLAQALEIPFSDIKRYNPEVTRWFTPPGEKTYLLRVPMGVSERYAHCCQEMDLVARNFQNYSIRGETATLADVARRFSINDANVLAVINGMNPGQRLRRGQNVKLPFRQGQSRRDRMYVDLYERSRGQVVAQRDYQRILDQGRARGRMIRNPTEFYTVKPGDSLWTVSRRTGVDMNTIIASNLNILENRMIRPGDRLAIR